jgi:hypothetical protein
MVQNAVAPASQNIAEIISKLEGIKAKLLSLPVQNESKPLQTPTPILQEIATPVLEKEPTPTLEKEPTPTAIAPPKKRSVEKQKPASDMPTLFDF